VNDKRPDAARWLKLALKLVIVLVLVWAVRRTLVEAWEQLGEHPWRVLPAWLVASGCLYLAGLLPAGLFWHRVLVTLGQDAYRGETLRAYYIGHLGKYVPGKAMVVVLRAGLIRGHRVQTGVAAVSVFFETLTMMASGAFWAAAILAVWFRTHPPLLFLSIGLMVVAGLPTLPPVFRRLVRLAGVGRSDPAVAERLDRLGYGTLLLGWVANTLAWVLLGLSFWAVLEAMEIPHLAPLLDVPRYTASVALAMVAGFLSLIPGGAVVRELILTALMVPCFTLRAPEVPAEVAALVSAVLLRLVWLVSDLVISGILYFAGGRKSTPA